VSHLGRTTLGCPVTAARLNESKTRRLKANHDDGLTIDRTLADGTDELQFDQAFLNSLSVQA